MDRCRCQGLIIRHRWATHAERRVKVINPRSRLRALTTASRVLLAARATFGFTTCTCSVALSCNIATPVNGKMELANVSLWLNSAFLLVLDLLGQINRNLPDPKLWDLSKFHATHKFSMFSCCTHTYKRALKHTTRKRFKCCNLNPGFSLKAVLYSNRME